MNDTTCLRCGSDKIIPNVSLADKVGDSGTFTRSLDVKVASAPDAWFFKDSVVGSLWVRICGECGHAELRVSNYRELYKKYRESLKR